MGRPKTVTKCKTHDEFVSCALRQGGGARKGSRHTILWHPGNGGGRVAVPRHNGDLATGTRSAVCKGLLAIGFLLVGGACSAIALALSRGGP